MTRPKVLLADDVRLFLEIEKSFFRHEDVDVLTAQGGQEALILARSDRPDLIILDLHMPDLDGDECCRQLKSDPDAGLRQIPILLVTASDHPEALERCRRGGCDAFITKPLTRENFLNIARRFLAGRLPPSPRHPARLLVRYGIDAENTLRHHSFNLAPGGIFLETPVVLSIDSRITVELSLPDDCLPVVCEGRVAWVNPAVGKIKAEFPAGLGVQFVGMAPEDACRLQRFLRATPRQPSPASLPSDR